MCDQLSKKQRREEMEWIQQQKEEARNNVAAGITDYTTASFFDLEAASNIGDEAAKFEIARRRSR